jgi:hypothetical protein
MSVTPFVITDEIKKRLFEIRDYSDANPYSTDDLLDMINGTIPLAGDRKEHSIFLEFGWKIVYSTHIQSNIGHIRQMSISLKKSGALPNPHVVEIVMALLGFKNGLSKCKTDLEDCGNGVQAVNVVEVIEIIKQ